MPESNPNPHPTTHPLGLQSKRKNALYSNRPGEPSGSQSAQGLNNAGQQPRPQNSQDSNHPGQRSGSQNSQDSRRSGQQPRRQDALDLDRPGQLSGSRNPQGSNHPGQRSGSQNSQDSKRSGQQPTSQHSPDINHRRQQSENLGRRHVDSSVSPSIRGSISPVRPRRNSCPALIDQRYFDQSRFFASPDVYLSMETELIPDQCDHDPGFNPLRRGLPNRRPAYNHQGMTSIFSNGFDSGVVPPSNPNTSAQATSGESEVSSATTYSESSIESDLNRAEMPNRGDPHYRRYDDYRQNIERRMTVDSLPSVMSNGSRHSRPSQGSHGSQLLRSRSVESLTRASLANFSPRNRPQQMSQGSSSAGQHSPQTGQSRLTSASPSTASSSRTVRPSHNNSIGASSALPYTTRGAASAATATTAAPVASGRRAGVNTRISSLHEEVMKANTGQNNPPKK